MKHAALHKGPETIGFLLNKIARELQSVSPTPRLDAEVLVMHVCAFERSHLITHRHIAVTDDQRRQLDALMARRQRGEPIAYLTGTREFWSMELHVSPHTLIPRPETELLVEKALGRIPPEADWTIADLGTGCGAIALALAKERPRCRVIATDISPEALEVARLNANKFCLTNVEFREGDWLTALAGDRLDVIVSNPPYIRADDPHLAQGDVRFEPRQALIAGADGMDAIRHLARHAPQSLTPGGWILFEHGSDQADAVGGLLRQHGYRDIVCHRDLGGHDRITECRM